MRLVKLLGWIMLSCASLEASEIWTYTGPVLDQTLGDPALRPPGLGDHFDITITFPEPTPLNFDFMGGSEQPPGAVFSWRDGSVFFAVALTPAEEISRSRVSLEGFSGETGHAFTGPSEGPDSVLFCGGPGIENCVPAYSETASAPSGAWTIAETPEPRSVLLVAGGLLALYFRRR
jgi:hypothetical protein